MRWGNSTRLISRSAVLAVAVAACGGTATPTAPPVGAPTQAGATQGTEPGTQQPGPGTPVENHATVVIGTETYEFSGIKCSILAPQYIQALSLYGDPQVTIVLPPTGWESQGDTYSPPQVEVKIGEEFQDGSADWIAGTSDSIPDSLMPDTSRVDSYTVPDTSVRPVTATGTATFVDGAVVVTGGSAEPVSGTFEVTCN
jgi:hypothetical protein